MIVGPYFKTVLFKQDELGHNQLYYNHSVLFQSSL